MVLKHGLPVQFSLVVVVAVHCAEKHVKGPRLYTPPTLEGFAGHKKNCVV